MKEFIPVPKQPIFNLVNLNYTLKFKLNEASFLSVIYEASPFYQIKALQMKQFILISFIPTFLHGKQSQE